MKATPGIHHVTAIASDPKRNLKFYTEVLGLRLVKLTVNYDDPGTYHLYFGDQQGRPGTILTFFPWPGAYRGIVGTGQVSATAFAIPNGSFAFWQERIAAAVGVSIAIEERFNDKVISFPDPDGMVLELIESKQAPIRNDEKQLVPAEYAIAGFHSVTLSVEGYEKTAEVLRNQFGFTEQQHEENRFRFSVDGQSFASIVDVLCLPAGKLGTLGAGTVHHVAFRAENDEHELEIRKALIAAGQNPTPVVDRTYFHSVYFREPGGVLFEIATDPPGFTVDESLEALGKKLVLPEKFESHRERITAHLPPLD